MKLQFIDLILVSTMDGEKILIGLTVIIQYG